MIGDFTNWNDLVKWWSTQSYIQRLYWWLFQFGDILLEKYTLPDAPEKSRIIHVLKEFAWSEVNDFIDIVPTNENESLEFWDFVKKQYFHKYKIEYKKGNEFELVLDNIVEIVNSKNPIQKESFIKLRLTEFKTEFEKTDSRSEYRDIGAKVAITGGIPNFGDLSADSPHWKERVESIFYGYFNQLNLMVYEHLSKNPNLLTIGEDTKEDFNHIVKLNFNLNNSGGITKETIYHLFGMLLRDKNLSNSDTDVANFIKTHFLGFETPKFETILKEINSYKNNRKKLPKKCFKLE